MSIEVKIESKRGRLRYRKRKVRERLLVVMHSVRVYRSDYLPNATESARGGKSKGGETSWKHTLIHNRLGGPLF